MILFDFLCSNQECQHQFEELVTAEEANPVCPQCQGATSKLSFCNKPSVAPSPKWAEIFMKGRNIRNKLTGKVPWRKNSESQS